jgi:FKBP-type peptidyl-prolyl cis-trans isomerase 2
MNLGAHQIISITYTTKDESGRILDSNEGFQPLILYTDPELLKHGLLKEMAGMRVNERRTVHLSPESGFGHSKSENIKWYNKHDLSFQNHEIGATVLTPAGQEGIITSIADSMIQVDTNHPFSDMKLSIEVFLNEIRQATQEEYMCGMPLAQNINKCCGPQGCC